jgi:hypothetical protein
VPQISLRAARNVSYKGKTEKVETKQKKGAELKKTAWLYQLKDAELEITARMTNTHAIFQARIHTNCVN